MLFRYVCWCACMCVRVCLWKGEKVHFAMMDHERPPFLMHTRTRQTPMRNEGERERERGDEETGRERREKESRESPFSS